MREVSIGAFARQLKQRMDEQGKFAFFLGAGCSLSSGIPLAGKLVESWLSRHHQIEGLQADFDEWCKGIIPGYDKNQQAKFYGATIDLVFPTPALRQVEIDRKVLGCDPGFGYATLAMLLSHTQYGPCSNIVFTTNFDDLVADSLYLFTNRRPLVITHNALSGFVRQTSPKPVVIKLHGDAHLSPMNTPSETKKLHHDLESLFTKSVQERGLIFMGYGANDESITSALQSLPDDAIPFGIFWVNDQKPQGAFGDWLTRRRATWVNHLDFDQAMLVLGMELKLDRPDRGRVNRIFDNFEQTERKLAQKNQTGSGPNAGAPSDPDVKQAVEQLAEQAEGSQSLLLKANLLPQGPQRIDALKEAAKKYPNDAGVLSALATALQEDDGSPEEIKQLYQQSIKANPQDAIALGEYAVFLQNVRKDMDQAEQYYRRAIDVDPKHATALGNYAVFLQNVRKDMDQAEQFYRRAIDADPGYATALSNYAHFFQNIRKNQSQAETFYQRAVKAGLENVKALINYAQLLQKDGKNNDGAQGVYQRALAVEPNNITALVEYARFLETSLKDVKEAENYYLRALDAEPNNATALIGYAHFLEVTKKDIDKAEDYYQRAIDYEPNNPTALFSYARFLETCRQDTMQAEEHYQRATDAAPDNADYLAAFAAFQENVRRDMEHAEGLYQRAEGLYQRAVDAEPNNASILFSYARFLEIRRRSAMQAEEYYQRATDADPDNADYLAAFAAFQENIRGDMERAEELYRRAAIIAPNNADLLGNIAVFFESSRENFSEAENFYKNSIEVSPKHANNLGNYALFLETIRQNLDEAEKYYGRAIEADPNNINNLCNFAYFLQAVRGNEEQAVAKYKLAVAAAPHHAIALAKLAQIQLARGLQAEGLDLLSRAFATTEGRSIALELELWFYRLAHDGQTDRTAALQEIQRRLAAGQRSPGWDLAPNVARARQDGHPLADLLAALAAVIADQVPLDSLNNFSDWPKC